MSTAPAFLEHLGLDTLADERAIRRAYARALKLIDQETNPRGFQELRDAYEIALRWVQHKVAVAQEALLQDESTELPKASQLSNPEVVSPKAENVTTLEEQTTNREDVLAQSYAIDRENVLRNLKEYWEFCGEMVSSGQATDEISWQNKLREILGRPEFDSMYARGLFEAHIAQHLADGWQPGHETLFVVAAKVFRWREEPSRLQTFGQAGAIIDAAVLEYLLFEDLRGGPDYYEFREAIVRLRQEQEPSVRELIRALPRLEIIRSHYPHWLRLITNTDRIENWRQKERQIPAWRKKLASLKVVKPVDPAPIDNRKRNIWLWFFVISLVIGALTKVPGELSSHSNASYKEQAYRPLAGNELSLPGRLDSEKPGFSQPVPLHLRVVYPSSSAKKKQQGLVVIKLTIASTGIVKEAHIDKSSGFSSLDEAALNAAKTAVFKPAYEYGKPVESIVTLPLNFTLNSTGTQRSDR